MKFKPIGPVKLSVGGNPLGEVKSVEMKCECGDYPPPKVEVLICSEPASCTMLRYIHSDSLGTVTCPIDEAERLGDECVAAIERAELATRAPAG